jgi:SAM-dependent methyltransferase
MRLSSVLETVLYYRGGEEALVTSFYRDVLGLEQVSDVAFRIGDSLVLLFDSEQSRVQSWPPPHGAAGPGHACFLCEPSHYETWKARLQDRGVEIIDETTWSDDVVSFYFNDPAGNVLEISRADMWPRHSGNEPEASKPANVPVAETMSYLKRVLPSPPARVLDVGCGNGEQLHALGAAGYAALGIDPDGESITHAQALGGRAVEANFLSFESEPFDVVYFGSSLHHIFPLNAALERAQELIVPGGLLVAEEFDLHIVDEATARWLYDLDSVLLTAGLLRRAEHAHHAGHPAPNHSGGAYHYANTQPLERWRIEHDHDPPLTSGEDMVAGIGTSFEVRLVERAPYLYRRFCERLEASERGAAVGGRVLEIENAGIAGGRLVAAGLRLAASYPGAQNKKRASELP